LANPISTNKPGVVVHACNLSYSGVEVGRLHPKTTQAKAQVLKIYWFICFIS
jgi:hypothetical protein